MIESFLHAYMFLDLTKTVFECCIHDKNFFVLVHRRLTRKLAMLYFDARFLGFKRLIPIKARALECWVLEPNV